MKSKNLKSDIPDIIDKRIRDFYANLNETKEEIIRAFIAKYGAQPDEIQLMEQQTKDGIRLWVEKKPTLDKWGNDCGNCSGELFKEVHLCQNCQLPYETGGRVWLKE